MAQLYFEYIILYHPTVSSKEREEGVKKPSRILTDRSVMLAENAKTVGLKAARQIPEDYLECLDEVEIIIRPFAQ